MGTNNFYQEESVYVTADGMNHSSRAAAETYVLGRAEIIFRALLDEPLAENLIGHDEVDIVVEELTKSTARLNSIIVRLNYWNMDK